ncbi:CG3860 [Drosophila busckii]|uniref:Oxysterol-binding protein n=1 Tax=Drosophila busckii TaxID=30019 RepID=A0A0M3QVM3_DROBS|nr:CG3860 [Drosophila busckii]
MAEGDHNECNERTKLPTASISRKKVSVWSILKNCIGKDLSKITMPVVLNEPLSFLQRLCEYMEYAELLTRASQEDNPADRMKYVAAFAVSALASNWDRLGKPFNPLLGETYELEKNNFWIICEQVSHHPPVSAFHAESPDYKFYGAIYPQIKICGKSIEVHPNGTVTVEFPKWKETYTWSNVNCCVHNIIVGKLWIEQHGVMEITNHTSGYVATLTFKSSTSSTKNLHRVEGFVKDIRLRPDILCLENGDLDGASKEKTRLEEKQRDSRKQHKHINGVDLNPRWFKKEHSPYTNSDVWIYTGNYWDRNYEYTATIF